MQEWLKNKKNTPIIAALAVVILLGMAGLIAMELGLFSGGSSTATVPVASGPPVAPSGVPTGPPGAPPASYPGGPPAGIPGGMPPAPGAPVAALPGKVASARPLTSSGLAVGPDPFYIHGGQKRALIANAAAGGSGMKVPLRDVIGPLDLFRVHPPTVPPLPAVPSQTIGPDLAANYRYSGIATGPDGSVTAILETGGQSQTVKPGDSLPDGSLVQNIQSNSITLRTAGGTQVSLPLSAGNPDQGGGGQDNGQPSDGG